MFIFKKYIPFNQSLGENLSLRSAVERIMAINITEEERPEKERPEIGVNETEMVMIN
jgi:hypothetical protein